MSVELLTGVGVIVLAGMVMGCTILPMKYAIKWKWENIWMAFTGFAQVIFPTVLIELTVPNAWQAYHVAKLSALASALLLGFGWGIGNTLSGIGYTMLGMGLGTSLVLGFTAAIGSLLPLVILYPGQLWSSSVALLYIGIGVMLAGLALSAQAGGRRQAIRHENEITTGAELQAFGKGDIRVGVLICVVSGILSSMLNLGLVFGDDIRLTALRLGASNIGAVNMVWLPVEASGFLATLFYCSYLLTKNRSWSLYFSEGTGSHWFIAMLMAAFFTGGLSLYGLGAGKLGTMGAIIGFPVFMSTIVLTGNTAGLVTGEWRGSPRTAYVFGTAGLFLLIVAIVCIGLGKAAVG
jgi:L-rhamnose-H+ transport protein